MKQISVVCEGRSEYVYLQRLQSFLEKQADGWDIPLQFFPKEGPEVNGGDYRIAVANYKRVWNGNRRAHIEVWVDYDIYLRDDRQNMAKYRSKPSGIPDFRFAFHTFEDFLVMHMEEALVGKWRAVFEPQGHFKTPLHSSKYEPLFQEIIPLYRKGTLSPDFITVESLKRLKKNMINPVIVPPPEPPFGNFGAFLIQQIEEAFPGLLA